MLKFEKAILVLLFLAPMFIAHVNANYLGNQCLEFDGADDYVSCASPIYMTQELTVELWIKPEYTIQTGSDSSYGHATGAIISYTETWAGNGGWALYFDFSDGHLWFIYREEGGAMYVDTTEKVCTNRAVWDSSLWHNVAVTFSRNSDSITFYVNKTIDRTWSLDIPHGIVYETADLKIGGHLGYGYMFQGLIDEVRFWNTCRTHSEIIDTWNRILNDTECAQSKLVGYWRFDEGQGLESEDFSSQGNNALFGIVPYDPAWWSLGAPIIPEFSSIVILPLFMIAILLAVIVYRRKLTSRYLKSR